jgi:drug/metabolite transporter (DMT)-like permease
VPNLLTALALNRIEAAPAALIHAATPLLVALLAVPLLREERQGARNLAGLLLGFRGDRGDPRAGCDGGGAPPSAAG